MIRYPFDCYVCPRTTLMVPPGPSCAPSDILQLWTKIALYMYYSPVNIPLFFPMDHNQNKVCLDMYYAIPATVVFIGRFVTHIAYTYLLTRNSSQETKRVPLLAENLLCTLKVEEPLRPALKLICYHLNCAKRIVKSRHILS